MNRNLLMKWGASIRIMIKIDSTSLGSMLGRLLMIISMNSRPNSLAD